MEEENKNLTFGPSKNTTLNIATGSKNVIASMVRVSGHHRLVSCRNDKRTLFSMVFIAAKFALSTLLTCSGVH